MALGSQTDLSLTEIRFLHRDETCMKKTIRSIRGAQRVYGSLRSCTFTLGDYLARGRSPCAPLTLGSFSNSHNFKAVSTHLDKISNLYQIAG
ncbi:hypothetical protein CSPX01_10728 [Colletotrichum filicis]|nr:hypothetical protein CSPX01_10728 [Colletotrichum filicis]